MRYETYMIHHLKMPEASGKIDRKRSRATTVEESRHFKTGKYNLAK